MVNLCGLERCVFGFYTRVRCERLTEIKEDFCGNQSGDLCISEVKQNLSILARKKGMAAD